MEVLLTKPIQQLQSNRQTLNKSLLFCNMLTDSTCKRSHQILENCTLMLLLGAVNEDMHVFSQLG